MAPGPTSLRPSDAHSLPDGASAFAAPALTVLFPSLLLLFLQGEVKVSLSVPAQYLSTALPSLCSLHSIQHKVMHSLLIVFLSLPLGLGVRI